MRLARPHGRRLTTVLPPLLVGLLVLPFILRQNSWWEWANPYWLLQRQAEHVSATGLPTLFLHVGTGPFNPYNVYYAGPLLAVLAYPAAVVGAWPTFVAVSVAAIVAGYLGIWRTARNLGLPPWPAVLPALAFTTTPYVLSDLYGRGAWAEFVAVNAVAVLLGGLTTLLLRPGDRRAGACAAVAGATAVIAGTHNLTLATSAVVLPFLMLALAPLRPQSAEPWGPAALRALGSAALGLGLVAAWLLPTAWYGGDTFVAQPRVSDVLLRGTMGLGDLGNVLSPWPRLPAEARAQWIYAQPPVLVMAWATVVLGGLVLLRRGPRARPALPAAALGGLCVALLALVAEPAWWLHFPSLVRTIQFPIRLLSYVAIVTAVAAALGLRALAGHPGARWATAALAAMVAVQVAAGAYVVTHSRASGPPGETSPRQGDVRVRDEPAAFGGAASFTQAQYRVYRRPTVAHPTSSEQTTIALGDVLRSDRGILQGVAPPGTDVVVPVVWSPFVKVRGDAKLAGRSSPGMAVVRVTDADAAGRWTAEVTAAAPWPLAAGRAISVLSLALVAAAGAGAVLRRRRRRERPAIREERQEDDSRRAPAAV
jgi:hypothetical protein